MIRLLDAGVVRTCSRRLFKEDYFRAWLDLAIARPNAYLRVYKDVAFVGKTSRTRRKRAKLRLTASRGGKLDHLIETEGLREARVILSPDQAGELGPIDEDDSHAADPASRHDSFRLLIHGTQPPGSDASKALQILKKARV